MNVSAPIVPFRETIILPPTTDIVNEAIVEPNQPIRPNTWKNETTPTDDDTHVIDIDIGSDLCQLKIRAIPLPEDATKLLEDSSDVLKIIGRFFGRKLDRHRCHLTAHMSGRVRDFREKLGSVFGLSEDWTEDTVDHMWAFGPRLVGPNILLNRNDGSEWPSLWDCLQEECDMSKLVSWDVKQGVINGFQLATEAGPLCEEPMRGVCFTIEHIQVGHCEGSVGPSVDTSVAQSVSGVAGDNVSDGGNVDPVTRSSRPAYTGQLMSCVKDGCRLAFQAQPQRMVSAMYSCVIQATADVLGKYTHTGHNPLHQIFLIVSAVEMVQYLVIFTVKLSFVFQQFDHANMSY